MVVEEIVNRPTSQPVDQSEMIYVVEQYIKDKKGVEVDINLLKGINKKSPMASILLQEQLGMLVEAFEIARGYYVRGF